MRNNEYKAPKTRFVPLRVESNLLNGSYGEAGKPSRDIVFDDEDAPII